MRQTKLSLIVLMLIASLTGYVAAQDPAQKSSEQQTKNEVEQALEASEKRGETVLSTCLKDCGDEPQTINGFQRPKALVLAKPSYSLIARKAHAQGEVEVRVVLDFDGKVIAASAISGHPLLQATCVRAARESEFTEAKLNGNPVKVVGIIRYNFIQ